MICKCGVDLDTMINGKCSLCLKVKDMDMKQLMLILLEFHSGDSNPEIDAIRLRYNELVKDGYDMKIYVTFGQIHAHRVNGHTFDKDSVAAIKCEDRDHGRRVAFELFGDKFMTDYLEEEIKSIMHYFPRGMLEAN